MEPNNNGSGLTPATANATPLWLRFAPVIFLILWSSGFTFAKMGLSYTHPMTLLALRYLVALLVLAPIFFIQRPPLPKTAAEWRHLIVVGLLIQVAFFTFVFHAIEFGVSAGGIALITSLTPIVVALLAPRFAREKKINALRWGGLVLGMTGAVLVILVRMEVEVTSIAGVLCGIGALIAMTLVTLYQKRYGSDDNPLRSNFIQYGVGLAATLPAAIIIEGFEVHWTTKLVVALGYLVLANSLISVTLLLAMIRRKQASRVSAELCSKLVYDTQREGGVFLMLDQDHQPFT